MSQLKDGVGAIKFGNGICHKCVYVNDDSLTCDAFPEGIPGEIFVGDFNHASYHYEGDNGLKYKENPNYRGA
ncbi:MAG: hypothetical protein ACOC2W_04555 [bacterium]